MKFSRVLLAIAALVILALLAQFADASIRSFLFPRLWARRHAIRMGDLNPQPLPPGSIVVGLHPPSCQGGSCQAPPVITK